MMIITASPKEFSERGVAAAEQGEYTLDNCSIHKMEEIEEAIKARDARVVSLPRYSPDLSPIENCWSNVKCILRSLKPHTTDELLDALAKAFSSVTLENILGWFNHCGYGAAII